MRISKHLQQKGLELDAHLWLMPKRARNSSPTECIQHRIALPLTTPMSKKNYSGDDNDNEEKEATVVCCSTS